MGEADRIKRLGEQIAQARTAQKMTQAELARAADVSRKMVNALENGRAQDCGYLRLCSIMEALGYEITFSRKPRLSMPLI